MNDTEQIRQIANSIIEGRHEENAVQQGAELLKLASEIENQRAEARKLAAEEQKITADLKESQQTRKHAHLKDYIALLAPLFTTVVLAGTLAQQSYQFVQSEKTKQAQFVQSERDKDAEARRQADAAEDLRWADAVRLLSQSEKLSPAGVILKSFIKSERYGVPANQTAMQVLVKTNDPVLFADLFNSVFDPVSSDNAPQVIDLARTLTSDANPLFTKSWNPKKKSNDYGKLSATEKQKVEYLNQDLAFVSAKLATLLRGPRSPGSNVYLRSVALYGNFEGADFSRADISGSTIAQVDVKRANFSQVTGYEAVSFQSTAWWQASAIDQGMLQYLIKHFPYDKDDGDYPVATSQLDYEAGVQQLQALNAAVALTRIDPTR